jgi:sensor histidine kinase YesM
LRFEQYRFGSRLHIERVHDPRALDTLVPPLILQPLVENAVTHGVTRRVGPSKVAIRSWVTDDEVVVAVEDDGAGMDPKAFLRNGGGIGMRNVQRRLVGLFGPQYGLVVRSPESGGTIVEVHLPRRIPPTVFSLVERRRETDLVVPPSTSGAAEVDVR